MLVQLLSGCHDGIDAVDALVAQAERRDTLSLALEHPVHQHLPEPGRLRVFLQPVVRWCFDKHREYGAQGQRLGQLHSWSLALP